MSSCGADAFRNDSTGRVSRGARCRHYVEPAYVDLHNERQHAGAGTGVAAVCAKRKPGPLKDPGLPRFIQMRSLLITWEAICLSGSVFGVCLFPISAFHRFVCVVWLPFAFRGVGAVLDARRRVMPISPARSPCGAAVSRSSGRPDRDVERPGRVGRRSDAVEGQRALLTFELQFALGDHLDVVPSSIWSAMIISTPMSSAFSPSMSTTTSTL